MATLDTKPPPGVLPRDGARPSGPGDVAEVLHPPGGVAVQSPLNVEDHIRQRFDKLSGIEKIQEYFYDANTGVPNERGFAALHEAPNDAAPQFAHFSIEGTKFTNSFGHDQGQLLYRMAAEALHAVDPNICKVRGDFATRVASRERAQRMAERANDLLPPGFRGFKITVATGPTLEAAGKAHAALKERMENAGVRAKRGARPLGVDAGWDPLTHPFPTKRLEREPHAELAKAYWALDREEQLSAYRDPMTGLLSSTGMGAAIRVGDKFLSIDVDGLKATDAFNSPLGDEVIRQAGRYMRLLGGEELQAAHPHGDEFGAAHSDATVLRQYADDVAEYLSRQTVCYTNVHLGKTFVQQGIGLSYGIGDTYEEAERNLEKHKHQRTLAGERDRSGELAIARGRLQDRDASPSELDAARDRERRAREHAELRHRNLESVDDGRGDRAPVAPGRGGLQGSPPARSFGFGAGQNGPGGVRAPPEASGPVAASIGRPPAARAVEQGRGAEDPTPAERAPDRQAGVRSLTLADTGIKPETLDAPQFRDRWELDPRGQIAFPHERTLTTTTGARQRVRTGLEIVGASPEQTPAGGKRGIWESAAQGRSDIARVVVVERAIDALSHYQLKPDNQALYVSTNGPLTPEQKPALEDVLKRQQHIAKVLGSATPTLVAAVSNSREGAVLARQLEEMKPQDMSFQRDAPHRGSHWHDALLARDRDQMRSHQRLTPNPQRQQGRGLEVKR